MCLEMNPACIKQLCNFKKCKSRQDLGVETCKKKKSGLKRPRTPGLGLRAAGDKKNQARLNSAQDGLRRFVGCRALHCTLPGLETHSTLETRQGGGGQVAGRRSAGLPTARAATCPPCSLSSPAQSREGARGRFPG